MQRQPCDRYILRQRWVLCRIFGVVYLVHFFPSLDSIIAFDILEIDLPINKDSLDWYDEYKEKYVSFKYEYFGNVLKEALKKDMVVVDLISADGNLIKYLFDIGCQRESSVTYIATDIDFSALKSLKETNSSINCICSDATKRFATESSLDLCFSNSIHHVPDASDLVFKNIEIALNKGGQFVGVESQGLLSKILILAMFVLPKGLIPKDFIEIYYERHLIKKWLFTPIRQRLKVVKDPKILKTKLFHVLYSFGK